VTQGEPDDFMTKVKYHPMAMHVRTLRKRVQDVPPTAKLKLSSSLRESILEDFQACNSVEDTIEFSRRHMGKGAVQILSEIEMAIAYIAEREPRFMCDIGTFDGGTSLLFRRFLPSITQMICIDLYVKNKSFLKLLAPPNQSQLFIDASSYADRTVRRVTDIVGTRQMDVLFIDGDHRYEGALGDFLAYRGFVRDGGTILFHDIVKDHGGSAWSGGVPQLWQELSAIYPSTEFIDDPNQDGFGIGAIEYDSAVELPSSMALHIPPTH
jgi:cephalosporin hydroxylase